VTALETRPRVLLADDDAALRRLIGATLGEDNFELLQAIDGEQALQVAREQRPGLVLLDVRMPRLDGFEVCRQLKSDPTTASIKVVMLTARGGDVDRVHAREVGADDYFSKPFSPVQLLDRVYACSGDLATRARRAVPVELRRAVRRAADHSPDHGL
jgi:DNA-binding response OmpR family regulator